MAGLTTRLVCSIIKSVCRCGGTGRRKGLKIPRWQQRTGSIPVGGTESKRNARTLVFAFLLLFMSAKFCDLADINGRCLPSCLPKMLEMADKGIKISLVLRAIYWFFRMNLCPGKKYHFCFLLLLPLAVFCDSDMTEEIVFAALRLLSVSRCA